MQQFWIGTGMSLLANLMLAFKTFCGKTLQIILGMVVYGIWIVEYLFVFYSPSYVIQFSFLLVYFLGYQHQKKIRRKLKVDISFVLLILLFVGGVATTIALSSGLNIVLNAVIMLLEMFAVYALTAQGMRYKSCVWCRPSILSWISPWGTGSHRACPSSTLLRPCWPS